MSFKDHFSSQAAAYGLHRPQYPKHLYQYLAERCPERKLAWDNATGNGQAALGLVEHFEQVEATDASQNQIAHAIPHPRIRYRVAPAEQSGLAPESLDLITVAQAYHWLPFELFFAEVDRVLKPGGLLAVWVYVNFKVSPAIDQVRDRWYDGALGPYWPAERQWVDRGYIDLPFPYPCQFHHNFQIVKDWNLQQLLGYLETWSAVARYKQQRGEDPLPSIRAELQEAWGEAQTQTFTWPITLVTAQKPA